MTTPKYTRTDSATARPSAKVTPTPNVPISTSGLAFDRWQEGERFGGGELPLGDLGGATQIGENPHDEPCRIMAIGSRLDDEIAVYPDSKKIKLRALGIIVPLPERTLDYWHGESADVPLAQTGRPRRA